MLTATAAKYRQSFTHEFMAKEKCVGHIGLCGGRRQIDGFGNPAIAVALKRGLHADVVHRRNVVGGHEEPAHVLRNSGNVLDRRTS